MKNILLAGMFSTMTLVLFNALPAYAEEPTIANGISNENAVNAFDHSLDLSAATLDEQLDLDDQSNSNYWWFPNGWGRGYFGWGAYWPYWNLYSPGLYRFYR